MNIEKRLAEIKERKVEIRKLLESEEQIDLNKINEELRQLEEEEKELRKRQEIAKGIQDGTIQARTIETMKVETASEQRL